MEISLLHRRDRIILTTIQALDELGIQGISTREIARREGISEGAIFKHFRSKTELLLALLEYDSQYDQDIANSAKLKYGSPSEAIIFTVRSYAEYYENYPPVTAITQHYMVFAADAQLEKKVKEIFFSRLNHFHHMINEAKNMGELKENTDCEVVGDFIWTYCRDICVKWRFENFGFPLKETMVAAVKMLLDAFSKA